VRRFYFDITSARLSKAEIGLKRRGKSNLCLTFDKVDKFLVWVPKWVLFLMLDISIIVDMTVLLY
jgi:hypothetical protein